MGEKISVITERDPTKKEWINVPDPSWTGLVDLSEKKIKVHALYHGRKNGRRIARLGHYVTQDEYLGSYYVLLTDGEYQAIASAIESQGYRRCDHCLKFVIKIKVNENGLCSKCAKILRRRYPKVKDEQKEIM